MNYSDAFGGHDSVLHTATVGDVMSLMEMRLHIRSPIAMDAISR